MKSVHPSKENKCVLYMGKHSVGEINLTLVKQKKVLSYDDINRHFFIVKCGILILLILTE